MPGRLYLVPNLLGIVPVDYRQPYDVREVIARIVDDSDFLEFKPLYGSTLICGWVVAPCTLGSRESAAATDTLRRETSTPAFWRMGTAMPPSCWSRASST